jgi:hypothetical protein
MISLTIGLALAVSIAIGRVRKGKEDVARPQVDDVGRLYMHEKRADDVGERNRDETDVEVRTGLVTPAFKGEERR